MQSVRPDPAQVEADMHAFASVYGKQGVEGVLPMNVSLPEPESKGARTLLRAALSALAGLAATMAAPAAAQSYFVPDVAIFEQVVVGEVEVAPVSVFRDTRCADIRFCTREDTLIVGAVVTDYRGQYEIVLELGRPTYVPGGFLLLTGSATRPAYRGAVPLSEYRLDLEFIPLRFD
ncbi:MAG: hypothetical protein WA936_06105 [Erythrobacter sp.]